MVISFLTTSTLPSRHHPYLPHSAYNAAMVAVAIGLQVYHPAWLSGPWLGWVSPLFPALLTATFVASVLHRLRRW